MMASPDHWQAMQITDAAVFYSRLCKWDDQFENLPPHAIDAQLCYSLAFHRLEMPVGPGHLVVDISRTLKKKMSSIRCYATQFPPAKQYLLRGSTRRPATWGKRPAFLLASCLPARGPSAPGI